MTSSALMYLAKINEIPAQKNGVTGASYTTVLSHICHVLHKKMKP